MEKEDEMSLETATSSFYFRACLFRFLRFIKFIKEKFKLVAAFVRRNENRNAAE